MIYLVLYVLIASFPAKRQNILSTFIYRADGYVAVVLGSASVCCVVIKSDALQMDIASHQRCPDNYEHA